MDAPASGTALPWATSTSPVVIAYQGHTFHVCTEPFAPRFRHAEAATQFYALVERAWGNRDVSLWRGRYAEATADGVTSTWYTVLVAASTAQEALAAMRQVIADELDRLNGRGAHDQEPGMRVPASDVQVPRDVVSADDVSHQLL